MFFAQIETKKGVGNIDGIVNVPGLDGIFRQRAGTAEERNSEYEGAGGLNELRFNLTKPMKYLRIK